MNLLEHSRHCLYRNRVLMAVGTGDRLLDEPTRALSVDKWLVVGVLNLMAFVMVIASNVVPVKVAMKITERNQALLNPEKLCLEVIL